MSAKRINWIIVIVGLLLFVAGGILLFNATNIGVSLARKAIQNNGGSLNTEEYYLILKSNTLSYQLGGTILSIIGFCTAIVGYKKAQ
jgi:hypothetical protein